MVLVTFCQKWYDKHEQSHTWSHSYPERQRDRPREAAATSRFGSGSICQSENGANSVRFSGRWERCPATSCAWTWGWLSAMTPPG